MSKPGWYQDHSGSTPVWRYWDGSQWTDSTAPIQTAPTPVQTQTTIEPQQVSGLELFGRRLAGYFIDLFLVYAVTFPFQWFLLANWQPSGALAQTATGDFLASVSMFVVINGTLCAIGYFLLQIFSIPQLGSTPGMKLLSVGITPAGQSNIMLVAFKRGCFFAIFCGIGVFGAWMSLSATGTTTTEVLASWAGTFVVWAGGPALLISLLFTLSSLAIIWSSDHLAWHDHWTSAVVGLTLGVDNQPAKPTRTFTWVVLAVACFGLITSFFVTTPIEERADAFVNELIQEGTLPPGTTTGL